MKKIAYYAPRLALLFFTFLILFALLEVLWRTCVFPRSNRTLRSPVEASPFPDVGYVFHPLAKVQEDGWSMRINSHGLRDKEFPLEKPAGTFRILVLGDSITAAEGVHVEDTFVSVLERKLNAALAPRVFHAINAGHAGYNSRQELAFLQHYGLQLYPDLILVTYHYNDPLPAYPIVGVDGKTGKQKWWVPIKNFLKFHSVFIGDVLQRIQAWSMGQPQFKPEAVDLSERDFPSMFQTLYDEKGPYWKDILESFAGFKRISVETGTPVMFMVVPLNLEIGRKEPYLQYYKQVETELTRLDFPFFDLVDTLKAHDEKSLWLKPQDLHFSVEAHQIVGEALGDFLVSHPRLLEPAAETRTGARKP